MGKNDGDGGDDCIALVPVTNGGRRCPPRSALDMDGMESRTPMAAIPAAPDVAADARESPVDGATACSCSTSVTSPSAMTPNFFGAAEGDVAVSRP